MTVSIGLIGPGLVGAELLKNILEAPKHLHLNVAGILSSTRMLLATPTCAAWRNSPDVQDANLDSFLAHVSKQPNPVIVDCTCDQGIADAYERFQKSGCSVVTANKLGVAGPLSLWKSYDRSRLYHESSCGAGLPVLSTISDLRDSGDALVSIRGIMSGSLGWLMSQPPGCDFSALVKKARTLGYTEPDPRQDLSGLDVARKVVILARVSGLEMDLQDVEVQPVCPEHVMQGDGGVEGFFRRLEGFSLPAMEPGSGAVWRFVGEVDFVNQRASAKLVAVPASSALGQSTGASNLFELITQRIPEGIVIQGPGAGKACTAFGCFSDILKIQRSTRG